MRPTKKEATVKIDPVFQIIVMGCMGGPKIGNLSGYLLSPLQEQQWITLDAGSLLSGIDVAIEKKTLDESLFSDPCLTPSAEMLIKHIRAYLISHPHLDHIAGLVLNSPIDEKKVILGTDTTIDAIRDHIFNNTIWPNYGSEGIRALGLYRYIRLPIHESIPIPSTSMTVSAFPLSHPRHYSSTAFLIRYKEDFVLYLGDTSSDSMETKKHLTSIWENITPLIRENRLRGILLECSHCRAEADQTIYGHLSSDLMMYELHQLAEIAQNSLQDLKVIVTHRKESVSKNIDSPSLIKEELNELNDLAVDFIFPNQGDKILL